MLLSYDKLKNLKILSLQVGGAVASIERVVIDPGELKIVAFMLRGPRIGRGIGDVLDVQSIREASMTGLIIDSTDELVERDDVIKIRDNIELGFELIDKKVKTKKGTRLGKVSDFMVNSDNLMIQQLIVQRPFARAIIDPELVIGRSEVVEVTDYEIIVKDEEAKLKQRSAGGEDFIPNFVNPFREPGFAQADNQNLDE